MPAPISSHNSEEALMHISDMPSWSQLAFEGYETLNRVQSKIYNIAFNSNENILVCAPTGAGKTNIAMITVLRELGLNMKYTIIQKDKFKIVYVAPMKALAAEMTDTFSRRLSSIGTHLHNYVLLININKWSYL